VGTKGEQHLHMEDLEVDDDEWQISAWLFKDQTKDMPLGHTGYGTTRLCGDRNIPCAILSSGLHHFSQDHFRNMFGPFPSNFSFEDLDQLTMCPYNYNPGSMEWTNKITGGHPLICHFACDDWLCACTIFAAKGFQEITGHFQDNCQLEFDHWWARVQEGIQAMAHDVDATAER
jgi:hypothetical protein